MTHDDLLLISAQDIRAEFADLVQAGIDQRESKFNSTPEAIAAANAYCQKWLPPEYAGVIQDVLTVKGLLVQLSPNGAMVHLKTSQWESGFYFDPAYRNRICVFNDEGMPRPVTFETGLKYLVNRIVKGVDRAESQKLLERLQQGEGVLAEGAGAGMSPNGV